MSNMINIDRSPNRGAQVGGVALRTKLGLCCGSQSKALSSLL
jgi:hypothetical protein